VKFISTSSSSHVHQWPSKKHLAVVREPIIPGLVLILAKFKPENFIQPYAQRSFSIPVLSILGLLSV
jgi:hypothetical protein